MTSDIVPHEHQPLSVVQRPRSRFLVQSIKLEEQGAPGVISAAVLVICVLLGAAVAWAGVTRVDEVARAVGEVVPAGSIQAVQHLEGGIVGEIMVRDGDLVEAGDVLIRLAPTASQADLDQMLARRAALLLQAERLRAFAVGRAPDWDAVVDGFAPLKADQQAIYDTQRASLESQAAVIRSQIAQREADLVAFGNQRETLSAEIAILEEEVGIRASLLDRGLASRLTYLDAQRRLTTATGSLSDVLDGITRTNSEVDEAIGRLAELEARLSNEALDAAGAVTAELAEVEEALRDLRDRVERLEVRAPVRGVVNALAVHSVNAVIQPGQELLEIVPMGDELVVEARVLPHDIGHVEEGQAADIRVSSYDFARFGAVPGVVRQLSASTHLDENLRPYYRAVIALDRDHVGDQPGINQIIPGMTVEADIKTGSKTILDYLLRPVSRGFASAFQER